MFFWHLSVVLNTRVSTLLFLYTVMLLTCCQLFQLFVFTATCSSSLCLSVYICSYILLWTIKIIIYGFNLFTVLCKRVSAGERCFQKYKRLFIGPKCILQQDNEPKSWRAIFSVTNKKCCSDATAPTEPRVCLGLHEGREGADIQDVWNNPPAELLQNLEEGKGCSHKYGFFFILCSLLIDDKND